MAQFEASTFANWPPARLQRRQLALLIDGYYRLLLNVVES